MSSPESDSLNLITPQGYKRLTQEYQFLKHDERPRIVEEVHHAAKQGDRSENAEYQYGKKRLREIDRRMRFLTKRIEAARIVDPVTQVPDKVRFGATVVLRDEEGTEKIVQIVGEDEIDLRRNRISWKSPVAKAIMGAKAGDFAEVKAPKGDVDYEIVSFRYARIEDE